MDCAIAAAGEYRVAAFEDGLLQLLGGVAGGSSRSGGSFNAISAQHRRRRFDVGQAPPGTASGEWIVEQKSFAHGSERLYGNNGDGYSFPRVPHSHMPNIAFWDKGCPTCRDNMQIWPR